MAVTANLDHDDVAPRIGNAAVLKAGTVEFERTPTREGFDRQRPFPEKHAVCRQCGLRRLRVLEVDSRRETRLLGARRLQRPVAGGPRYLRTIKEGHRFLLAQRRDE